MVLVLKWPFFQLFFLANIGLENVFYDILERKNAFLGYKNRKFKKSKNGYSSKGVKRCFCSTNRQFFNFFFLGDIGQENVFDNILEQKIAFLAYKNKKFKKSKNYLFSNGFGSKMSIFPTFFLSQYRPGKSLL